MRFYLPWLELVECILYRFSSASCSEKLLQIPFCGSNFGENWWKPENGLPNAEKFIFSPQIRKLGEFYHFTAWADALMDNLVMVFALKVVYK